MSGRGDAVELESADGADDAAPAARAADALTARARLVGAAALVGLAAGGVGVLAARVALDSASAASDLVFALGSVALGFGLLGWSGSALLANSIGAARERLDAAPGWTERGSRRAMARIGGFGGGVMVAAASTAVALAAIGV